MTPEQIIYSLTLLSLCTVSVWYLIKMTKISNSNIDELERIYNTVPKMRNPPLPPPKTKQDYGYQDKTAFFDLADLILKEPFSDAKKKFKKQELVNLELKDSITGDLLDTVKCKCGSYYSRDTYEIHGCPNCKKPIINKK